MSPPGSPVPHPPVVDEVRAAVADLGLVARGADLDRSPKFPQAEFRGLGERHLLGLRTAIEHGGRGLPLVVTAAALHELAYASGTTFAKLSLQPEFCTLLADHGSSELRDRWFRPLTEGRVLVGNHITEPGAGSDAGALSATARREGDTYILDGTKSEAAFADDAEAAIVYARTGSPLGSARSSFPKGWRVSSGRSPRRTSASGGCGAERFATTLSASRPRRGSGRKARRSRPSKGS